MGQETRKFHNFRRDKNQVSLEAQSMYQKWPRDPGNNQKSSRSRTQQPQPHKKLQSGKTPPPDKKRSSSPDKGITKRTHTNETHYTFQCKRNSDSNLGIQWYECEDGKCPRIMEPSWMQGRGLIYLFMRDDGIL